jgi:hypothetical protein
MDPALHKQLVASARKNSAGNLSREVERLLKLGLVSGGGVAMTGQLTNQWSASHVRYSIKSWGQK